MFVTERDATPTRKGTKFTFNIGSRNESENEGLRGYSAVAVVPAYGVTDLVVSYAGATILRRKEAMRYADLPGIIRGAVAAHRAGDAADNAATPDIVRDVKITRERSRDRSNGGGLTKANKARAKK